MASSPFQDSDKGLLLLVIWTSLAIWFFLPHFRQSKAKLQQLDAAVNYWYGMIIDRRLQRDQRPPTESTWNLILKQCFFKSALSMDQVFMLRTWIRSHRLYLKHLEDAHRLWQFRLMILLGFISIIRWGMLGWMKAPGSLLQIFTISQGEALATGLILCGLSSHKWMLPKGWWQTKNLLADCWHLLLGGGSPCHQSLHEWQLNFRRRESQEGIDLSQDRLATIDQFRQDQVRQDLHRLEKFGHFMVALELFLSFLILCCLLSDALPQI